MDPQHSPNGRGQWELTHFEWQGDTASFTYKSRDVYGTVVRVDRSRPGGPAREDEEED